MYFVVEQIFDPQLPDKAGSTLRYNRAVRFNQMVDPPGGEGGIRTHDPVFDRILLFESRAFSRSATSPDNITMNPLTQEFMGRCQYTFCLRLSTIFGTMVADRKAHFKTFSAELQWEKMVGVKWHLSSYV